MSSSRYADEDNPMPAADSSHHTQEGLELEDSVEEHGEAGGQEEEEVVVAVDGAGGGPEFDRLSIDVESDEGDEISSMRSLRSGDFAFEEENGRTYHRFSKGKYILPNDVVEQDRLGLVHELWKETWTDRLCLCPKRKGAQRVLDVGTGTGVWAIAYADEHPEATIIGADLSPIQPSYVPSTCMFEVEDLETEWQYKTPFDFIFVRHMNSCFASWENMLEQAFQHLEPGGYIELHDNSFPILCPDDSMPETSAIARWSTLLMEGTRRLGRPIDMPSRFKSMLEDAGFEAVVEHKRVWPTSPWPADYKLRKLGVWVQANTLAGLEASMLAVFTRVLGWTVEATTEFCDEVRAEILDTKVHAYWNVHCVYGRKPLWAT